MPSPCYQGSSVKCSPNASTPLSRSPVKSKPCLEPGNLSNKMSTGHNSLEDMKELVDTINVFPTANQSPSDTTLKDMLVSLGSSLHTDMMECLKNFNNEVGEHPGRVDHIEHKMGEFAPFHNSLIDAHNDRNDKVTWLKAKIADLVDRSCRNNVKIR